MTRFNPDRYDPAADSSANHKQYRQGSGPVDAVLLDLSTDENGHRTCPSGCRLPLGKNSRFRMGHDAKLLGILKRAHVTGTAVVLVRDDQTTRETAMDVARAYTSPKHDWPAELLAAEKRFAVQTERREKTASEKVRARAEQTQAEQVAGVGVGDTRQIKVGRWAKTGKAIAVYVGENEVEFEYADAQGNTKTVRVPAAKLAEAATSE